MEFSEEDRSKFYKVLRSGETDDKNKVLVSGRDPEIHLAFLKWLQEIDCILNESMMVNACSQGYLNSVKWLFEQGCPMNKWCLSEATEQGHLEVLNWLRANDCPD